MSINQDTLYETETMAELYATQGRLQEAIAIYRRLLDGHPDSDRCAHWIERLEALEQSWGHAAGEEIEPEPIPLARPARRDGEGEDDSVTVAWSLPPADARAGAGAAAHPETATGVETTRRSLRLEATEAAGLRGPGVA